MNMNEIKKKKGLKLLGKILMAVTIPLILLVVVAGISLATVGDTTASGLTERELSTAVYAVEQELELLSNGDFTANEGILYKGDYNLSADTAFFDEFKSHTNVDITIFWGNERLATSVVDHSGARAIHTTMSDELYNTLCTEGSFFSKDVKLQ